MNCLDCKQPRATTGVPGICQTWHRPARLKELVIVATAPWADEAVGRTDHCSPASAPLEHDGDGVL